MRLGEASYDMTAQAFDRQPDKGDENLRVQFTNYPHFNQEKSSKEGRPIYDEVPYVTIIVPGQTDVVHRVAWAKDFRRFPRQWDAFHKNQNQDAAAGTPLKVVPWIQQNQVKELEYFNVFTVEQLANMPDSTTIKFMAIQKLKQLAKDFLVAAKEAAPLTAMRAELDNRDGQIATMQQQMDSMKKMIDKLVKEQEQE
jgi:hypothetical protein